MLYCSVQAQISPLVLQHHVSYLDFHDNPYCVANQRGKSIAIYYYCAPVHLPNMGGSARWWHDFLFGFFVCCIIPPHREDIAMYATALLKGQKVPLSKRGVTSKPPDLKGSSFKCLRGIEFDAVYKLLQIVTTGETSIPTGVWGIRWNFTPSNSYLSLR